MDILIVDDDENFCEILKKDLFDFFSEFFEEVNISSYSSDFSSLKYEKKFKYAFIDIDLPNSNGIEIATNLKGIYPKSTLTFISSHINLIHNSLIAQPFYFVRKSVYKEDISNFFELVKNQKTDRKVIDLCYDREKIWVFVDEIICVEAQLHKLIIKTSEKEYNDHRSLKEIINKFPKDTFFRVHKSYIINLDHLISLKNNSLRLVNNDEIMIGRIYRKDFEMFYQRYLIK